MPMMDTSSQANRCLVEDCRRANGRRLVGRSCNDSRIYHLDGEDLPLVVGRVTI